MKAGDFMYPRFSVPTHNGHINNNNSSYKAHNTAIASLCAGDDEC